MQGTRSLSLVVFLPVSPPRPPARLIETARTAGAFVAFDASGDVLRAGLRARPHLIKPNKEELADLIGVASGDPILAVQRHVIGPFLDNEAIVLLSLGAEGAVLIGHDRAIRATLPPVTPKNTVGSGDALLAGYLDARARGLSETESLVRAVAVGAAAALQEAVGVVDPDDIERVQAGVRVVAQHPCPPALLSAQSEPKGAFG